MNEVNSIALKLDELINSMQNAGSSSGGESPFTDSKKKKSGQEKMGEMKNQQQSLKEQLKGMIQKMKSQSPGGKERSDLAKMLAQREMMRKAMESLSQEGSIGKDAKEKLNQAIEMMKQVERDIIYDKLNDNTIKKDDWITTRLLEAETAEKERENENRRESREFKGEMDPAFIPEQEKEQKQRQLEEGLKYREIKLKRFYQKKYEEYINRK